MIAAGAAAACALFVHFVSSTSKGCSAFVDVVAMAHAIKRWFTNINGAFFSSSSFVKRNLETRDVIWWKNTIAGSLVENIFHLHQSWCQLDVPFKSRGLQKDGITYCLFKDSWRCAASCFLWCSLSWDDQLYAATGKMSSFVIMSSFYRFLQDATYNDVQVTSL